MRKLVGYSREIDGGIVGVQNHLERKKRVISIIDSQLI